MTLPTTIDPVAVGLAADLARRTVGASHYGACDAAMRDELVERCVALMMEAGVFVRDGKLFMPST